MNTKNSKTNESHRFKYDLIDKLDLKSRNKNMALGSLNIYYTWKNVKSTYNNNKFKISAPTWNETFDLPDGSYNIPKIQDYIEYIIKKHETIGETTPILIYTNTINNNIVFKIKTRYKLELLSKETMKLLGSTKDIIDSDKNSENVPRLENVEVVLVHCNLVNNTYQQALIGNKIADRITKSTKNKEQKEDDRIMEETQELIITPEKREQIIKDLKLF